VVADSHQLQEVEEQGLYYELGGRALSLDQSVDSRLELLRRLLDQGYFVMSAGLQKREKRPPVVAES